MTHTFRGTSDLQMIFDDSYTFFVSKIDIV